MGSPELPGFLTFDVTAMNVTEPAGAFGPTTIIPRNQAFTLSTDFKIDGWIGKGLNDLPPVGPPVFEYNVTYYAESIGPGPDYKFPPGPPTVTLSVACIKNQYSYGAAQSSYTVPANTMQEGTYKLTAMVKMSPIATPGGQGFPWHVLGFVEGPMIDIYIP
jgi:hypothetical protein